MADGTSVGKISLDIDLTGDISAQISEMAGKIGTTLKKSIDGSTKGMFDGIEKTIDKSMENVRNIITQQLERMRKEAAEILKSLESILKKIKIPKSFGTSKDIKVPAFNTVSTAQPRSPPVPQINTGFDAEKIRMQIDNLTQSLDITNAKISQQKERLAELQRSYEMAFNPAKKNKLQEEILKVETNINKLISTSDKTGFKLADLDDKLLGVSNSTKTMNVSLNDTVKKLDNTAKASTKLGKNASGLGKVADNVGNRFSSMGRMISSALKRVLIMATLYKVIRGFMSYMGSALATNQQFSNSLAQVKTNLQVAFMPIYQAILPAINALMSVLAKATAYIASFTSALFGKTYKQSFQAAKGLNATKAAMAGVGKQAKKTAKDVQKSLAGFDEINNLDTGKGADAGGDSGGGSGFEMVTPSIDMGPVETSMKALADKLKTLFAPSIASLKNLWGAMEPFRKFVAQGAVDFWNNFLKPVGKWVFGEGIPRFIDALANGFASVDWERINGSLNNLWKALTPFAINVGEGLLWFWESVLVPLGTWTMNNVVPLFLDILAEAIRVVNNVVEALKPLGQWLFDNFLKPLAEWTGGVIVTVLEGISSSLSAIGDWISENQPIVEALAIVVGSFAAAWGLVNAAILIWNGVAAIATGVTTALGGAIAFLTSPIGIAIAIIGALIAAGVLLYKNWDKIKEFAGKLWDVIKNIFGKIGNWIGDTWDNVKKWTSEKWGNVKDTVSNAAGKIKDGISTTFNNVKDKIGTTWENTKAATSKAWETMQSKVKEHGGGIKGVIGASTEAYKTIWNAGFNKMDEITGGKMSKIRSSISNIAGNIQANLSNSWSGISSKAKSSWNNIKNAIVNPVESAKNTVKKAVDAIAGFFRNIKIPEIKIPKIKLPHFNLSGKFSLSPLQVPKIGVNWYDKGGIFNEPSVIGVGEKRPEFVGALDDLRVIVRDEIVAALSEFSELLSGEDEEGDLILKVDGDEFGRIAIKTINKRRRKAGLPLIEI